MNIYPSIKDVLAACLMFFFLFFKSKMVEEGATKRINSRMTIRTPDSRRGPMKEIRNS